jgi:branched-chain amino acid transport system substrate-binding protein
MNRFKFKKLLFVALGILLLLVFMILACVPKVAPPTKERAVTVLHLTDLTGPIAGLGVPAAVGTGDIVNEFNAKGDVNEVKINYIAVDTRTDTARGVSAYRRYRTEPKLLWVSCITTGMGKAIMPLALRDRVVLLPAADGEFQANIGWVFLWGPCYQNAFGATIDFIIENWKAKGKPGMPTIGYIAWDNAGGREPLRGGKEYAEKMGVKLLPPEFFPTGTPEHTVWLSRLANGGPDYILIGGTVDPTPSNILRDAYKLGLTKTIQFIDTSYWGPTEGIGIKLHPEATEGAWTNSYYLRGDEAWAHPLLEKLVPKYHGKSVKEFRETMPAIYVTGVVGALPQLEAVTRAVKAAGYEKVDGEVFLHALESLTGEDIAQGLTGPCVWSPVSRQGSDVVKFYAVKGGKEVPISGWRKVPDCVALHDWSKD